MITGIFEDDPAPSSVSQQLVDLLEQSPHEPSEAEIRTLIARGADPNALIKRQFESRSALHVAATKGYCGAIRTLVACGGRVDVKNGDEAEPLFYAASFNHVDALRLLLSLNADPLHKSVDGMSALHGAAYYLAADTLNVLLDGAARQNVNDREETGNSPLHLACISIGIKRHQELPERTIRALDTIRLLLDAGADPTQTNEVDMIPLMNCAMGQTPEATALLLPLSGDINRACNTGLTALHFASDNCSYDNMKLLLAAGANPNLCGHDGRSTIYHTLLMRMIHIESDGRARAIRLLADWGADVNQPDPDGRLPLSDALLMSEFSGTIEALLDAGARIPENLSEYLATASRLHQAQERFDVLMANHPVDVMSLSARDLILFTNAGVLEKVLAPDLWQNHVDHFCALLAQVPPCVAQQAYDASPLLMAMVSDIPLTHISSWECQSVVMGAKHISV